MTGLEKLRYLLATSPQMVITGCLLLSLVGVAGAGVTYANPPMVEVTEQTDQQKVHSAIETRAIVEKDTTMYTRGEVLTNHPVYLREPTPNVTISAITTTPEDTDVSFDQELLLIYEARSDDGNVFWQRTTPLATLDVGDRNGEEVTEVPIQISAIEQELQELRAEVGDAGTVSVHLQLYTSYDMSGRTGEVEDRGELKIREDSYTLPQLSGQQTYHTDVQRNRPVPSKVLQPSIPGIGSVVVPHATFVFIVLAGLMFPAAVMSSLWANRVDAARSQTRIHYARYEDWISKGTLPETLGDQRIYMSSIEELADIAIDMEKRIIHDKSRNCYAVVDGTVIYVFTRETESI